MPTDTAFEVMMMMMMIVAAARQLDGA